MLEFVSYGQPHELTISDGSARYRWIARVGAWQLGSVQQEAVCHGAGSTSARNPEVRRAGARQIGRVIHEEVDMIVLDSADEKAYKGVGLV